MTNKELLPLVKAAHAKAVSNKAIFENSSNPCIVKSYHEAVGEERALDAVLDALAMNSKVMLRVLAGVHGEERRAA